MNSSWTDKHVRDIWKCETQVVYPPCDMKRLLEINSKQTINKSRGIISIGQFRPEKNHTLQIMSVIPVLKLYQDITFTIVGSCRNEDDLNRVNALKDLVRNLGFIQRIDFIVNGTEEDVRNALSNAKVGLHTMTDEHFGIGIIEYLAAGVIAIAHDSGGPKDDILVDHMGKRVGYLATTEEEYAQRLIEVFEMDHIKLDELRKNARVAVEERFSTHLFRQGFLDAIKFVERN